MWVNEKQVKWLMKKFDISKSDATEIISLIEWKKKYKAFLKSQKDYKKKER